MPHNYHTIRLFFYDMMEESWPCQFRRLYDSKGGLLQVSKYVLGGYDLKTSMGMYRAVFFVRATGGHGRTPLLGNARSPYDRHSWWRGGAACVQTGIRPEEADPFFHDLGR